MARPDSGHEERKAELVRAASITFASYGYDGASNKRIAEQVRASTGRPFTAGLIYHYFPEGKGQLFGAVMNQFEPLRALGRALYEQTDAPPDIYLRHAARTYLTAFKEPDATRLMHITFMEGPRHPELAERLIEQVAPHILLPLAGYFIRQAELGRLQPISPLAAVLQFFGPLLARVLVSGVLGNATPPFPMPDDEAMIESHVRVFLNGLTAGRGAGNAE